ncbi:hypothetical protein VNI00_002214 [Paramarasmius palmivorus]|uniref:Wbp11/ELF5/Saf1 N-terminal domain-containing protein n=1 Tax=Paramarasmius palmivorus TaxID=297713 RepID=A0AAW0E6D2_9AGAR
MHINKAERSKARDFALVKKDTGDLEDEIEKLEGLEKPSADDKTRLTSLKSELEHINKKKEEYVKEHPEQRRLVYRARRDKNEGDKPEEEIVLPKKRNYFNKNGLPRHPERSIYYDPVMNPYGVAPPGMPYMERPLLPGEVDSEAEDSDSEDDDEDDIAMPEGPPPDMPGIEVPVDSDDDIPMPDGPAPGEEPGEADEDDEIPPPPPLPLPPSNAPYPAGMPPPPPPPGVPVGLVGVPPPPPGPPPVGFPMPPAGFPVGVPPPPPPGLGSHFPPFAPNLPPGVAPPPFPPQAFQPFPPPPHGMPAPPPGFYPRQKSASSIQDPLSSVPHETYQAHRANKLTPHPSLPPRPMAGSNVPATSAGPSAAATVSAEPQLRDFKKEATAFVPTSLKRKKGSASTSRVNAAPGVESESTESDLAAVGPARPDLVSTIQSQFGLPPPGGDAGSESSGKRRKVEEIKPKKKDDYEKFMEEMGDVLNPS